LANTREVSGAGVVGKQPVLQPDERYEYESSCYLQSDVGLMHGEYIFKNLSDNSLFKVSIPEFILIIPYKLN
jgi:ApaG protein